MDGRERIDEQIPKQNVIAIQTLEFELRPISIPWVNWYWTQFNTKPSNIDIQTHPEFSSNMDMYAKNALAFLSLLLLGFFTAHAQGK